ncbi:MAG TPA: TetR/AcrR family transcriptional regulator [Mycobacterium sp.]|nr:TetR/AcrR family transcriptional regulator [Mycobacterium sp.]
MVSTAPKRTPRRKYDNSRRRADAEARQRRIVEAATALFVQQGFVATSIDQIAAAADVSPQTIYATYGSKAAVLSRAIDVAVLGDYDDVPLIERMPALAEMSGNKQRLHFATAAHFVRELHERVAPLMRVMEQAASTDPGLEELRTRLVHDIRADCVVWIAQLGPKALRPDLSEAQAADVMVTVQSPYLYSTFTVDLGWSPARYEQWLAHALRHLLLRPELLRE